MQGAAPAAVCDNAPITPTRWGIALALCLIPSAAYEVWKGAYRLSTKSAQAKSVRV